MSLRGKLLSELEINAPAEKYYKFFKLTVDRFIVISSKFIQNVQVHEGDWDSFGHGSIKIWNYTVDGKAEVFKERVEFDDRNMTVTHTGLEGDVFKYYNTFKVIFRVVPNGPKHSSAIMTVEYEKKNENVPYPYMYLDILNGMTKDVEAHLKG